MRVVYTQQWQYNECLKMLYDFSAKLIQFNTLVPISIFKQRLAESQGILTVSDKNTLTSESYFHFPFYHFVCGYNICWNGCFGFLLFWFVFVVYFSAHIYCTDDVRVCDRRFCCAQNPPIPLNIVNNMHHLRFVLASSHSNFIHGFVYRWWCVCNGISS